jgi:hypothetical protein
MYSPDYNSDTGEFITDVFDQPETGGAVVGEDIESDYFRIKIFQCINYIRKTPLIRIVVQKKGFYLMPFFFEVRMEVSQSQGIMRIFINYRGTPPVLKRGGN